MSDTQRPDNETADEATNDTPLGGDETTEEQLTADNAVEEDTLATLDPENPPA